MDQQSIKLTFQHLFKSIVIRSLEIFSQAQRYRANIRYHTRWSFSDNNHFFRTFYWSRQHLEHTYILGVLQYANVVVEPSCTSSPKPILPRAETTQALSHQTLLPWQQSWFSPETKLLFSINK